jgi:hypothetical protein
MPKLDFESPFDLFFGVGPDLIGLGLETLLDFFIETLRAFVEVSLHACQFQFAVAQGLFPLGGCRLKLALQLFADLMCYRFLKRNLRAAFRTSQRLHSRDTTIARVQLAVMKADVSRRPHLADDRYLLARQVDREAASLGEKRKEYHRIRPGRP